MKYLHNKMYAYASNQTEFNFKIIIKKLLNFLGKVLEISRLYQ